MRFVDQFHTLFFDMNGTFMFSHDRLGPGEDFFSTYRRLGGHRFTAREVSDLVLKVCDRLRQDYDNPDRFESFPRLFDAVVTYGGLTGVDAKDIAAVVASHEVGQVPPWAANVLRTLAKTHSLALVSNVWAPPEAWEEAFSLGGISRVFRHRTFSSAIGAVKPSSTLFLDALRAMGVNPASAAFIGDSIDRDIRPAKKLGFSTVLVGPLASSSEADLVVSSIAELLRSDA